MANKQLPLPRMLDATERMHFQPIVAPEVAEWIKAEAKAHHVSASVVVSHLIASGYAAMIERWCEGDRDA